MSRIATLCAALSLLPSPVVAQAFTFVMPGDLIRAARVGAEGLPNWVLGRVVATTPTHLLVGGTRSGRSTVELSWTWITRLQVNRGRRGKPITGMAVGLLTGIPVGATAGWIRDTRINDLTTRQSVQRGLRIGAVSGLVLGGIIGTLVRVERWEDISHRLPQIRADVGRTGGLFVSAVLAVRREP